MVAQKKKSKLKGQSSKLQVKGKSTERKYPRVVSMVNHVGVLTYSKCEVKVAL